MCESLMWCLKLQYHKLSYNQEYLAANQSVSEHSKLLDPNNEEELFEVIMAC